jgi:putative membrane protein
MSQEAISKIERPDPSLMTYYTLACLLTGPLFPIFIIPSYFRYHTMRYRFDADGVSMRWGILFRREINLTYSRIQDIHLTSNFVERWLGLARVQIQTASGSASAEMTIEGVKEYEVLRDFLYSKMRGHHHAATGSASGTASVVEAPADASAQLAATLREVASELRALRRELDERRSRGV